MQKFHAVVVVVFLGLIVSPSLAEVNDALVVSDNHSNQVGQGGMLSAVIDKHSDDVLDGLFKKLGLQNLYQTEELSQIKAALKDDAKICEHMVGAIGIIWGLLTMLSVLSKNGEDGVGWSPDMNSNNSGQASSAIGGWIFAVIAFIMSIVMVTGAFQGTTASASPMLIFMLHLIASALMQAGYDTGLSHILPKNVVKTVVLSEQKGGGENKEEPSFENCDDYKNAKKWRPVLDLFLDHGVNVNTDQFSGSVDYGIGRLVELCRVMNKADETTLGDKKEDMLSCVRKYSKTLPEEKEKVEGIKTITDLQAAMKC